MDANGGNIYKLVTHALLGIISFLAVQIYLSVGHLQEEVYAMKARLLVLERVMKENQ